MTTNPSLPPQSAQISYFDAFINPWESTPGLCARAGLSAPEFLFDSSRRITDFLHCSFELLVRHAEFLGPVLNLVILMNVDAARVLGNLFGFIVHPFSLVFPAWPPGFPASERNPTARALESHRGNRGTLKPRAERQGASQT